MFSGITKTTKILIQTFTDYDTYKDEIPSIVVGNYAYKLFQWGIKRIIVTPKESIPKVIINGKDLILKVNYIDDNIDFGIDFLSSMLDLNVTTEKSGIYKLIIEPLLYNENIKYTIHIFNYTVKITGETSHYNSQKIIENFGDITINETFVKNSSGFFEYTFDVEDKITSSYNYFIFVAEDLKTGLIKFSYIKQCNYLYKDNSNTTLIIILVSVFLIIVIAIVVIIIIIRKRKKNKKKLNIEEQEQFLN